MSSAQNSGNDCILAVDDTLDNLILLQTILEDEGYQVELAESGKVALDKIQASPPQLLLLDVMMPGMDGYEVTRLVRQNAALPFIPILLITAHDQASVVVGLDNGADDFIRKPFEMEELLARVRSLLRLKHSIDAQEKMLRQREDFVSRLTHDLRTPLVAADRMFHLLLNGSFGEVSTEMEEAITSIVQNNQNLLRMVNMLLEVYRHEAGRKTLTFSSCNLLSLLQEVITELSPLAQEKDLQLNFEPSGEISQASELATIMGDNLELRRVFTNLIGNAIKFTDHGHIAVRLSRATENAPVSSAPHQQWIRLDVEDTGPGISPEDQTTLFQRFRQGNHRRAGSGLGLHLSYRIIEAHNGTVTVASALGQGSTFMVWLPVQQP